MINPNDSGFPPRRDIIPQAFRWRTRPTRDALLSSTNYNIAGEDGTNAKSDARFAWLQQMKQQGVADPRRRGPGTPRHAVRLPDEDGRQPEAVAALGLKVAITEADVRTFVDGPTTQVPTDHLATFAQPL